MDSGTLVWVIVGIAVVLVLIGVAIAVGRRRGSAHAEQRRHEAEQLREDAAAGASGLQADRAEAQQARAEADAAQARAAQAERNAAMDEATVEDRVREADRVDPDVDHTADEYRPEYPDAASGSERSNAEATGADPATPHEVDRQQEEPGLGGSHRA